ncbi:MAG TPA: hypothetical protein VMM82_08345, partial [Spirochaetia bacterium]|nr:hypothetical protein [Spirochaetia bacterium]
PVGTATWIDATVEKGKTYFYRIIEVNSSGVESAPSPVARITVTSSFLPSPPAAFQATLTPKGVSLTWKPSTSPDARAYLLYRAPYKGAQFSRIGQGPVAGTSALDEKGKKDNFYAVATVDSSGNESARVTSSVTVPGTRAAQ